MPFGAERLSYGTLRFLCLVTLLCLSEKLQKEVVCIDEPELGLHPYAITIITELIKKYAGKKQVIAATQSVEFINAFGVENVIVVNNKNETSVFYRLLPEELEEWLEEYTIGELWQKNITGGRP